MPTGEAARRVYRRWWPEVDAGGFTRADGTLQFYGRVQALLDGKTSVLDFGAGRGVAAEDECQWRRKMTDLRAPGRSVTAADVDDAVLQNPRADDKVVLKGFELPFADNTFDLIVADHVFEHISDPAKMIAEFDRVLKPGGWLCARTPYLFSLLVLASSVMPSKTHAALLTVIQPGHKEEDVFPTLYRLNSFRALRRHFRRPDWNNYSYTWSPEPGYHFGSPVVAAILAFIQYVKRPFGGETLLIFMQKTR
jgi:SAM-dependent methyltransferase